MLSSSLTTRRPGSNIQTPIAIKPEAALLATGYMFALHVTAACFNELLHALNHG